MVKSTKIIKKKFWPVEIPLLNRQVELYASDLKSLDNKRIILDLTRELKGKNADLKLIIKADDKSAIANPIELKLVTSYLRRMMRKGVDYSEDSLLIECKDHRIRIKPFMITRKRVHKKVLAGLRENAKKYLEEQVKKKSFEELIIDVIDNKLQKELSVKLKKVYPLALCEIKFLGIEDKKEHEIEEEKSQKNKESKEKNDTKNIDSNQA